MRSVVVLEPGPIDARTGGYLYNSRMVDGLRARGWSAEIRELDPTFPSPSHEALAHAAGVCASLGDGTVVVVDSLALGAMADLVERHASRLRIVALVHLPLDTEGERRAIAAADRVIVTSQATLPMLAKYGLPPDRFLVIEPGTDRATLARGSGGPTRHLLCVATLIPRKGHEILLRALASIPHRDWRLTCAGSLTLDPATADRVGGLARSLGIEGCVSLVGELDAAALAGCYDSTDIFVLATLRETYGMVIAEALARGLPVVSTATGAIPVLVGDDAGVIVPPGDVEALADALTRVIGDDDLRAHLADGARHAREWLPSWDEAIEEMSRALDG